MPTADRGNHAGLSDLLENDLSAWEFFSSLPGTYRRAIEARDIGTFEELQSYTAKLRSRDSTLG